MELWHQYKPWRDLVFHTHLSPEEIVDRLGAEIGKQSWFSLNGGAAWVGQVSATQLTVQRVINYRNSFQAIAHGTIAPTDQGSVVTIRLRMHGFVVAFLAVWMSGATLGGLVGLAALLTGNWAGLIGLFMPLAGATMTSLGFKFEADKLEQFLRERIPSRLPDLGPYRTPMS
ncbi:MAG: hypothetical protein U0165_20710 [Polyangiaceae bacterium]